MGQSTEKELMALKKEELQALCDRYEIKYQQNDTKEMLAKSIIAFEASVGVKAAEEPEASAAEPTSTNAEEPEASAAEPTSTNAEPEATATTEPTSTNAEPEGESEISLESLEEYDPAAELQHVIAAVKALEYEGENPDVKWNRNKKHSALTYLELAAIDLSQIRTGK